MSSRHSEKIVRVDIRIPKEIYERIQAIAVSRYRAKIHHRSGKPEVGPTILELIKMGITQVEAEVADSVEWELTEEIREKIQELDSRLTEVESKLSGAIMAAPSSKSQTEGKGLNDLELGELLGVSNLILRDYRVYGKKPRGQALAQELAEKWVVQDGLWFKQKSSEIGED